MAPVRTALGPGDRKGVSRVTAGGGVGLAAGVVGFVLPVGLVLLSVYGPAMWLPLGVLAVDSTVLLALAGALLFTVSFALYRSGWSALHPHDPRFGYAAILCRLGMVALVPIAFAVAISLASSDSLVRCIHGAPTHALSCLRSAAPLVAYSGIAGFWIAWLGGAGITIGLVLLAQLSGRGLFYGSAIGYALLLLVLIGPFLALLLPIPGLTYPLLAAPALALAAPGLAYAAGRRTGR